MNEKTHYDNLERLAKESGLDGLNDRVQYYTARLNDELHPGKHRREKLELYIAELYNTLDMLCIHFDCADEVQDRAELLCAVQCTSIE